MNILLIVAGAVLMLAGIVMSVSGHKTERQFYDYIKLSLDKIAEDIAKISSDGMF